MVLSRTRLSLGITFILALGAAPATGQSRFLSHRSMRPLPTACRQAPTKGPTYFVDAAKGDDTHDGSRARPWKTIQPSTLPASNSAVPTLDTNTW